MSPNSKDGRFRVLVELLLDGGPLVDDDEVRDEEDGVDGDDARRLAEETRRSVAEVIDQLTELVDADFDLFLLPRHPLQLVLFLRRK